MPVTIPMALLALLDSNPSHGFALKRRYDDKARFDVTVVAGAMSRT